jgi:hypothetical protein
MQLGGDKKESKQPREHACNRSLLQQHLLKEGNIG